MVRRIKITLEKHSNLVEWVLNARFMLLIKNLKGTGFPSHAVVKNPPANAGDMGSSPGPGRFHMPRSN